MEDEIKELLRKYRAMERNYISMRDAIYNDRFRDEKWGRIQAYQEIIADLKELLSNEDRSGV